MGGRRRGGGGGGWTGGSRVSLRDCEKVGWGGGGTILDGWVGFGACVRCKY